MPTVTRSGPPCRADPSDPRVSASTHDAPPCSRPYGWMLPATGMVPTTRSALASRIVIPIRSASVFLLAARYVSMTRALSCSTVTSAASRAAGSYQGRLRAPHSQAIRGRPDVQAWPGLHAPCGRALAPRGRGCAGQDHRHDALPRAAEAAEQALSVRDAVRGQLD